jgi:hypothetical protein
MDKPSGSTPQHVQQPAAKDGLTDELRGLLQQAGIISTKKSKRGNVPLKVADKDSSSITGFTPKQRTEDDPIDKTLDDPIDKAGHAVITVLSKAVSISNEEHKRATALADDLANKLRTTERRIKELEAEAASFRDRAARAEEWMQRILREIQSKFIAPGGALPKTASGSSNQDL